MLRYVLTSTIFLLGIAIGIAIRHYHNIPLVDAINIIDVATLIVTIFLAVYIPGVFDRHMQVKQDKKVLIERRLSELQDMYRKVNQQVQDGAESVRDIFTTNNTLDVAWNRLHIIGTLLEYLELNESFEEELAEIRSLCSKHKKLLFDAHLSESDIIYPESVRNEEEKLYNAIDKATSILIFKINDI